MLEQQFEQDVSEEEVDNYIPVFRDDELFEFMCAMNRARVEELKELSA